MAYWGYSPYVSVAARRRKAEREVAKRRKAGQAITPVTVEGRTIAKTFWGKAWCENLESYSDYENRLPRGRTYVRNGSVVDLQISSGSILALVSGSELYEVSLTIVPLPKTLWKSVCDDCAGAIDSLVELLQGRFSKGTMERLCRQKAGLFPSPGEIRLRCSCPDSAGMCKHIAAVLYGVGARLDQKPELLFVLRGVDEMDLIAHAGRGIPLVAGSVTSSRVMAQDELSDIFGLDMAPGAEATGSGIGTSTAGPAKKTARASTKTASRPEAVSQKNARKAAPAKAAVKKPVQPARTAKKAATPAKKAAPKQAQAKKVPEKKALAKSASAKSALAMLPPERQCPETPGEEVGKVASNQSARSAPWRESRESWQDSLIRRRVTFSGEACFGIPPH